MHLIAPSNTIISMKLSALISHLAWDRGQSTLIAHCGGNQFFSPPLVHYHIPSSFLPTVCPCNTSH